MKEKFFANLLYLILLNLIVKPFYVFGVDRVVQLRVNHDCGEGTYGLYFALFNFTLIFYIVLDLGFTDYNRRMVSRHPYLLRSYLPDLIVGKSILAFFFFLLIITIGYISGYRGEAFYLLLLLGVNQVLISALMYFRSCLAGLFYFKLEGLFSVLDRFTMIGLCGFMLWGPFQGKLTLWHFAGAQTIAYGLSVLLSGLLVFYYAQFPRPRFHPTRLYAILLKSLPFALLVFLMGIYTRIDGILLERLLTDGKPEADIYAKGYRLLDAVQNFALLFAGLLVPLFARMLKEKLDVSDLVKVSFQTILVFSLTSAVGVWFYRNDLSVLLYGSQLQNIEYAGNVLGLLMISFVGLATIYIYGSLLTANGSLKQLNTLSAGAVVLNLGLNFALIPYMKAEGAAITACATQILAAIVHIYYAQKILHLKNDLKLWGQIGIFAILLIGVWVGSTHIPGNWVKGFIAGGAGSLLIAFVTRMIDLRELFKILKTKGS